MGCVIRRKYRDRSGKLRKLPKYYIRYTDAEGTPHTEPAYRDLQSSKALLAKREGKRPVARRGTATRTVTIGAAR